LPLPQLQRGIGNIRRRKKIRANKPINEPRTVGARRVGAEEGTVNFVKVSLMDTLLGNTNDPFIYLA